MHALYIIIPVLAILALSYRYYSAFIATRVMVLDDTRTTPAHARYDGANYHPTCWASSRTIEVNEPFGSIRSFP